jgi:hypothetical protein
VKIQVYTMMHGQKTIKIFSDIQIPNDKFFYMFGDLFIYHYITIFFCMIGSTILAAYSSLFIYGLQIPLVWDHNSRQYIWIWGRDSVVSISIYYRLVGLGFELGCLQEILSSPAPVQNGPEFRPSSRTTASRFPSRWQSSRSLTLTTHPHWMPR